MLIWMSPCPVSVLHMRFFRAGPQQASVWGEELAAALSLPVVSWFRSWDLLHHLFALHPLEPGPFPLPSPHQHVDCKSRGRTGSLCRSTSARSRANPRLMSIFLTMPPLFSPLLCLLSVTFQPPFILSHFQWPFPDNMLHISQSLGGHRGQLDLGLWQSRRRLMIGKSHLSFRCLFWPTPAQSEQKHVRKISEGVTYRDTATAVHSQCVMVGVFLCPRVLALCAWWLPCVWTPCLSPQGRR